MFDVDVRGCCVGADLVPMLIHDRQRNMTVHAVLANLKRWVCRVGTCLLFF